MAKPPVLSLIPLLLFMLACLAGQIAVATPTLPYPISVLIEAEDYEETSPAGVRPDDRGDLSGGRAIHIGGDNDVSNDETGRAQYKFRVSDPQIITTITIRYADDVGGDTGVIFLDGNSIASFSTIDTGTWDDYITIDRATDSIQLQPGPHTLRLEVKDNGTYGFTLDYCQVGP